ncbi:MAG: ABC transporter substrate-binding protein [Acidimicrobiales bacterium]
MRTRTRSTRVYGGVPTAVGLRSGGRATRIGTTTTVLVALALLATACGARIGPYLGGGAGIQGGSNSPTSNGAAPGSGGTGSGTGIQSTNSGGSATGGTTGSNGGGSTATTSPAGSNPQTAPASQFPFTPAAEASACTGTAGNTASAPGITPSAIQLGNVSGLSGPLSGSFPQGPQAVSALVSAVNAAGGICGRKLDLTVEDDGQDATTNKADVDNLIAKPVFAFAGSTSDADNGGVADMAAAGIPDFGFAINCNRSESTDYWSAAGGSCDQPQGANGPYYVGDGAFALAQSEGYLPKRMAFLAYDIAISAQAAEQFAYVYTHTLGGTICYEDTSISPVSASLEADVAQMQSNNCGGVFDTLDVTGNAKLLQAMQQQSYSLPYVVATFDAYTPVMVSTAGASAAQGLIVGLPFIPLNENQPMDVMYQQQLQQYEPGDQPSGFGFLSWLSAQMMIYSLLQAGRNPTEASLLKVLNSLKGFTAGGAVGPYTPSDHSVAPCNMDEVVHNGTFVRKAPASGLYCGGKLTQAS